MRPTRDNLIVGLCVVRPPGDEEGKYETEKGVRINYEMQSQLIQEEELDPAASWKAWKRNIV